MTRPVSQTGLGLGLGSWSYTFGLVSNTVVHDKTLCDMIMLKYYFVQYSRLQKQCQTLLVITFFYVFCTKLFFDNKRACCNRRVFSVMYSCCCLTGLGLVLSLTILVLVLVLTCWSCFHHCLTLWCNIGYCTHV